jgi:hypothetical protein
MRRRRLLSVVLLVAIGSSCNSPLEPGNCRNGRDGLGRGPFVTLRAECAPAGADVECRAERLESGYCAGPNRDVTSVARWISTDNSVGTFTVPGHFQARAVGVTTIYAEAEALYSQQAFAFAIDPAGAPQQKGVVDVIVWQTTTGGFLPGASVEFFPHTGNPQTCQQGLGAPYTPCRFWSDLSAAVVRASMPGYSSVAQSVTPIATGLSTPTYIVLRLTPSQ